jgi:hypothetical protein
LQARLQEIMSEGPAKVKTPPAEWASVLAVSPNPTISVKIFDISNIYPSFSFGTLDPTQDSISASIMAASSPASSFYPLSLPAVPLSLDVSAYSSVVGSPSMSVWPSISPLNLYSPSSSSSSSANYVSSRMNPPLLSPLPAGSSIAPAPVMPNFPAVPQTIELPNSSPQTPTP